MKIRKIRTFFHTLSATLLALTAGCQADNRFEGVNVEELARTQLAAEPEDSDAALILREALARAEAAGKAAPPPPADGQADSPARAILVQALNRAQRARDFTISQEAPLPAGWPKPSLPGLIRIKNYPAVRAAWVRDPDSRNNQFRVLFRHIQKRDIAMTAPVVMEYDPASAKDPAQMDETEAMAFLYRQADQDQAGQFEKIQVANDPPMQVVSVGMKGAYSTSEFRKRLTELREWLQAHPQWQAAGPPRVLGYNSPFMLWWNKYSEVQIPVTQKPDSGPTASPPPADKTKPGASATTRPAMPALTDEEKRILLHKGTERAFTGKYWNHFANGVYVCRQCGAELYTSNSKFRSECGWPSFDDEIRGAVKRLPDADGRRTEILCAACGGHLGHVFEGERFTPKNTRHCVNSASIVFVPAPATQPASQPALQEAIFAGGCFWGVEHHFQQVPGVIRAESGYTGGTVKNPTYQQVCTGKTGHAEAVRVTFDPARVSYEKLARLFFEVHDPTTLNRQGPDAGTQYRSAVYVKDEQQKQTVLKLIQLLKDKGYKVVTEVQPAGEFYLAEDYHQDYLEKHPGRPSCHVHVPRFDK